MKKTNFIIFMLCIATFIGCKPKKTNQNEFKQDFNVESSYLLLPIQEKSPEVKVMVEYPDKKSESAYFIRLAEDSVDYWMKMDVSAYKGQTVTLSFENVGHAMFGVGKISQSDTFDYDYNEMYRPAFHFSPEYGWMNDPNGMVYLDGEYHLFYQYNPYGSMWGNMHWGHAVSSDLTSWTYLPTPIAPDSLGAIFSGSAVVDTENSAGFGKNAMVAIYTSAGEVQAQSIAYSNDKGRTFTKYEGNPVIPNSGIVDFRDPKVFWHKESNSWIMSLATKQTITFYGSKNLKEWTRLSEFGEGLGAHTGVWECPDLFPLKYQGKDKWVLLVSINPGGPNSGSATQCFIGSFDGKQFTPDSLPYPLWLDYGRDNYAGVTWSNIPQADGRRIFIGWMSNWEYANQVPTKYFRSANTVPRELTLAHNGKHMIVRNYPVKEVFSLFGNGVTHPTMDVNNEAVITNMISDNEGSYKIEMEVLHQSANEFGFTLFNDKNEELKFDFDLSKNEFKINRAKSGLVKFNDNFAQGMVAPLETNKAYRVTLLVDKASVELFINGGSLVLTSLFFPTEPMNHIKFQTSSGNIKINNLKINKLKH